MQSTALSDLKKRPENRIYDSVQCVMGYRRNPTAKRISQQFKYFNFKCEQSERHVFVRFYWFHQFCSCPLRKISLATGTKSVGGNQALFRQRYFMTATSNNCIIKAGFPLMHFACRQRNFHQRNLEKQIDLQNFAPAQLNCRFWWSLTQDGVS